MNIFRVDPIIYEYGQSSTPFLAEMCNYKMYFICNLIHVLLESLTGKGCNPKPWQKEVGHCLDQDESKVQLRWHFWGVKSTYNFLQYESTLSRVRQSFLSNTGCDDMTDPLFPQPVNQYLFEENVKSEYEIEKHSARWVLNKDEENDYLKQVTVQQHMKNIYYLETKKLTPQHIPTSN